MPEGRSMIPATEIPRDRGGTMSVSRRDFLGAGAAAAAGLALPGVAGAMPYITVEERTPPTTAAGRPVIISASNGYNRDPNGKRGIEVAYQLLTSGSDPLDAIVAGVQ